MDQLVRTFLPVFIWHFQKIFGPVFTRDEWSAFVRSLLPPPDNLTNTIKKEYWGFNSQALLSSTERRRIRDAIKSYLLRRLRNDPMALPARNILCQFKRDLEDKDLQGRPRQIFKWRDVETDINSRWGQAIVNNDFPEELRRIAKEYPDAPNFLWELALYGRGQIKPTLSRKSSLFTILGLDYEQFAAGDLEDILGDS